MSPQNQAGSRTVGTLGRVVSGSFGQAIALFAAIWLGVIAEDHTGEIWQALHVWQWRPGQPVLWYAVAFYACLAAALGISWWAHRVSDRDRREQDARRTEAEARLLARSEDLATQSAALRELVQTLPPKDILTRWARHAQKLHEFRDQVARLNLADPASAGRIREAIRGVLGGIIKVVRVYENAPPSTVMAANLMVFVPRHGLLALDGDRQREIEESLTFAGPGMTLHSVDGILALQEALSTRSDLADMGPDDRLQPMRFPIPTERELEDGRTRVLPGAPTAWASRVASRFYSQDELLDWCRTRGAYPPGVTEQLRGYLRSDSGRAVQSFLSLPMPDDPATRNPIGVLNVHSDQPGLLRNRQPEESLFVMLQPALTLLSSFLSSLKEAETAEPAVADS